MIKLILIQGDALKVLPTLESESVDLVLTDPPYPNFDLFTNEKTEDFYISVFSELYRILKKDRFLITFWSISDLPNVFRIMEKVGFNYVWQIINYIKNVEENHIRVGFSHYNSALVFEKGRAKRVEQIRDVIEDATSSISRKKIEHPTPKTLKVVENLIKFSTREGDIVLDPFLGSGTTMIACRNLKRSCIGIEINPRYVEIAKQRLNWGSFLSNEIECEFKVIKSDRYSIY
jgi:DNA modification methylase